MAEQKDGRTPYGMMGTPFLYCTVPSRLSVSKKYKPIHLFKILK